MAVVDSMDVYEQTGDDSGLLQSLETIANGAGIPVAQLQSTAIVNAIKSNWAVITLGVLAFGGAFTWIGIEVGKQRKAKR